MVSHEVKRLRRKDLWNTPVTQPNIPVDANDPEAEADQDDDDDDYMPSGAEPSWAKKLKKKMKKLLCMESHGQYMAHVAEKKSRTRHKELMRQLGATLNSGSEGRITDEDDWVRQHCHWTGSDPEQPPANDGGADDPAMV